MKLAKGCLLFLQSGWIETESGSKHRLHKLWPAWELHFSLVQYWICSSYMFAFSSFFCLLFIVLLARFHMSSLMSPQTLTNTDKNLYQHPNYASSIWDGAVLEIVCLDLFSDCKHRSVKRKLKMRMSGLQCLYHGHEPPTGGQSSFQSFVRTVCWLAQDIVWFQISWLTLH